MKTVLILGAGTGGIIAAQSLQKQLGKKVRILLFEKEERSVFAPSLLWLMVGLRKRGQVFRPTEDLKRHGFEVVSGEIQSVDPMAKRVTVNDKVYEGEFMVVALGAAQTDESGLGRFGHDFYTLDGALSFSKALEQFQGGRIAVVVPSLPFKCPAAPYEASMLIEAALKRKGIRQKTTLSLIVPEVGPMGVAGKELSDAVRKMVESKGINYHPEYSLVSVESGKLDFKNKDGVIAQEQFDLLAFTPDHRCPKVIMDSPLRGKGGWIEVDKGTMETSFPDVYAIGDVTQIPLTMGKPLPKAGVFAHYQAETVAHNIAKKIKGETPDKVFTGDGQCFLEMGNGKAGYAGGDFYAQPLPKVKMKRPGLLWHLAKVWFEKYWFFKYF